MKINIRLLTAFAFCSSVLTFTGCIDETVPTDMVLQDEVETSPNTTPALLKALASSFNTLDARTGNYTDYAIGYGGLMHIRDVQTEDMAVAYSDYDHFQPWETGKQLGDNYARTQWLWNYPYEVILSCNKVIGTVKNVEDPSYLERGALGAAYAQRAAMYLDLAREFEFLSNDKVSATNSSGNNVEYYTVPIVTEDMTKEDTKNNPRVKRDEMAKFIESDLDSAYKYIDYIEASYKGDKTLPHKDVVDGLYARLYMWLENYPQAAAKAKAAITEASSYSSAITLQSDCMDDNGNLLPTCFNTLDKWMWGVAQTSENSTVTSGICNWTSWMSPDFGGGYAGAGAVSCIYIPLYNKMKSDDWRRNFYDATDLVNPGKAHKFQPNEGNTTNSLVACAAAYPLMRLEEMYFILAEAEAHTDAELGKSTLETFMTRYRSQGYTCAATSQDDIIREIITQKRIELWGEGQSFFDIKRLNYSVDRTQDGSNFFDDARFKTNGRPAWMNWVIVRTEENSNSALVGWNNPDPTDAYTPVISQ